MNETEKLIEEQLKILPPNLQRAINLVPWKSVAQEIGRENALDAEQIASLEQETMFVIYMFENPNDYISNIKREVGISEEIATTIAESVADKIFDLILKKSEKSEEPVKAKPEPIMTSAVPEIPPTNLPMVEKGEVAHDARPLTPAGPPAKQSEAAREPSDGERVPHVEPTTPPSSSTPPQIKQEEVKAPLPDYRYQEGKDPYREPLG